MNIKDLVSEWFNKWEEGDFIHLPISEDFEHTSPYGTISGKKAYIDLVASNKDKFLGHRFDIKEILCDQKKACIMYTAMQPGFTLEVTEWHFEKEGLINKIVAYYNIPGEISESRKLKDFD